MAASEMQMFPTDSAYSFRRKLELVDKISYLTCDRTDKSSRFIASAMHPVRQWIAAIDSLHNGECVVWNYKTQEVVFRFQLNASNDMYQEMDYEERDSDIATTTLPTTLNVLSPSALARQALAKTTSPNSSYLRVSRRSSSLQLLFYDFEVIQETAKVPIERTWHNEWLILIANSHIMTFDLNHNGSVDYYDTCYLSFSYHFGLRCGDCPQTNSKKVSRHVSQCYRAECSQLVASSDSNCNQSS